MTWQVSSESSLLCGTIKIAAADRSHSVRRRRVAVLMSLGGVWPASRQTKHLGHMGIMMSLASTSPLAESKCESEHLGKCSSVLEVPDRRRWHTGAIVMSGQHVDKWLANCKPCSCRMALEEYISYLSLFTVSSRVVYIQPLQLFRKHIIAHNKVYTFTSPVAECQGTPSKWLEELTPADQLGRTKWTKPT